MVDGLTPLISISSHRLISARLANQGCLPMSYPLPKWVMGNGFWWMGGLPITLPIQVWVMGVTRPITHAYRCVDG